MRTQEYCGYFTRKDACTQVHGCEWSDGKSVIKAEKKKQNNSRCVPPRAKLRLQGQRMRMRAAP